MPEQQEHRNLWRQNVAQAFHIIRAHRLRSGLLILGVAIGITTILAMVTVMSGLTKKINADLESAHKPYLFLSRFDIFVSGVDDEEMMRREKFEPDDVEYLEENCSALDRVCYFTSTNEFGYVLYYRGEHTPPLELNGSGHTFPEIFSLPLEHGRHFTEREVQRRERVIAIGYGPAQGLFPHENPIGKMIAIENRRYKVVGTFANREHFIGSISNNFAVIPHTTYQKDFETDQDEPSIAANVRDGFTMDEAREQVEFAMRVRRRVAVGEESDFVVTTSEAFMDIVGGVTAAVSGVLVLIASIGLVVGGIGVMNIMLISVTERTREIGVRMALGATRRDIVQQFLTEAATLTGIGGVVGTAVGVVAAALISNQINFPFHFSIGWTIAALLFSALIGIIFGLYPARRAARLNPVEALRFE